MSYVIAIDVGLQNFGLCIFDFSVSKVVLWNNISLVNTGKYMPKHNVKYIMDLIQKYNCYFMNAFAVVIERQMRCNMRIVESVLHALTYDNCIIINPKAMKVHYNLSTKNYRGNKLAAIQWVDKFCQNNAAVFDKNLCTNFMSTKKQDDLADSLILLLYYLNTYSNHMTGTVTIPTTHA